MERISYVWELEKDDFHYNVYDELMELYNNRVNDGDNRFRYFDDTKRCNNFYDFFDEFLEYVKDDNNENFKKYNRILNFARVECKLCLLKKDFLEIEKDTCVFIVTTSILDSICMFYLKENSKNIEIAKEVWINELNYGNLDSFDIKDKDKYITKCLTLVSNIQMIIQTKFVVKEIA